MDVYVIPIGQDQYELYCEPSVDPPAEVDGEPTSGLFGRFRRRFVEMIRAAEDRQRDASPASKSWLGRMQDRSLGWVAQRIAEQRLLWNLRRHTSAEAAHPHDMTFDQVMTLVRRTLRRDYERHRLWLVIDGIGWWRPHPSHSCRAPTCWRTTSPSASSDTGCRCGARHKAFIASRGRAVPARRSPSSETSRRWNHPRGRRESRTLRIGCDSSI